MSEQPESTLEVSEPVAIVYPLHIQKFQDKMDFMKQRLLANKKEADDTLSDFRQLEKAFEKAIKKMSKQSSKQKKHRKPSGFALPVPVTDELCDFMGLERGTHIPRTEVTKKLMTYISENKLQNPEKKSVIVPNDPLLRLLGDEVKDVLLTHFTIQKYINKHFLKRQVVSVETVTPVV
jgi:chromatin remodeling complex protein RSC6